MAQSKRTVSGVIHERFKLKINRPKLTGRIIFPSKHGYNQARLDSDY